MSGSPPFETVADAQRAEIRAALRTAIDRLRDVGQAHADGARLRLLDPDSRKRFAAVAADYDRKADILGGLVCLFDDEPMTTFELLRQLLGEAQLTNEALGVSDVS